MPHFASPHLAMPGLGQGSGPGLRCSLHWVNLIQAKLAKQAKLYSEAKKRPC